MPTSKSSSKSRSSVNTRQKQFSSNSGKIKKFSNSESVIPDMKEFFLYYKDSKYKSRKDKHFVVDRRNDYTYSKGIRKERYVYSLTEINPKTKEIIRMKGVEKRTSKFTPEVTRQMPKTNIFMYELQLTKEINNGNIIIAIR